MTPKHKIINPAHYTQQPVECIEFAQHKFTKWDVNQ